MKNITKVEKIEEVRKRKIEEENLRRIFIINLLLVILISPIVIYIGAIYTADAVVEFCRNKTGIYEFPNCSESKFCFGMGVVINCTRINEEHSN
jgi:hypothetical protein